MQKPRNPSKFQLVRFCLYKQPFLVSYQVMPILKVLFRQLVRYCVGKLWSNNSTHNGEGSMTCLLAQCFSSLYTVLARPLVPGVDCERVTVGYDIVLVWTVGATQWMWTRSLRKLKVLVQLHNRNICHCCMETTRAHDTKTGCLYKQRRTNRFLKGSYGATALNTANLDSGQIGGGKKYYYLLRI